MQKGRSEDSLRSLKLRFGNFGIFFYQQGRVEFNYLLYVKKILKKIVNKNIKKRSQKRIWFFFSKNWTLTKKSKNSRMGKGKGSFLRWCYRMRAGTALLEFKGYNFIILYKLKHILQKKIPLKLVCIRKLYSRQAGISKYYNTHQIFRKIKTL